MSKKVLIAGAPTGCWTNAGDEAIFAGMLNSLRREMPGVAVSVVSSNPGGFLSDHGCVNVPYDDVHAIAETIAESDLVILGGGSIFFDIWGCDPDRVLTPRHEGLSLWAGLALLARAHRKPLMIYAAGAGPLSSPDGELLARVAFEAAHVLTARDAESLALMKDLGGPAQAQYLTADPSAGLEPASQTDITNDGASVRLGVALRPWDVGCDPEHWEGEVAEAIEVFALRHNAEVVFVPLHRKVDWPLTDDQGVAERICKRLDGKIRTRVVPAGTTGWEVRAAVLAGCDLVLAQRLHGVLFAHSAGVPTVALNYDPKVGAAMAEWGAAGRLHELSGLRGTQLAKTLKTVYAERKSHAAELRRRASELFEREQKNAKLASEWTGRQSRNRPVGPATRQLLDRHLSKPGDRPGEVTEQLKSLVKKTGRKSPSRRPKREQARVGILTNRVLDWETGEPCIGGAERYVLDLSHLLVDLGLEPRLFQLGPEVCNGDYFGIPVEAIPAGKVFSEFHTGVCDEFARRTRDFEHAIIAAPNYAAGRLPKDSIVVCHGVWWDHDLYDDRFSFRSEEWTNHLYRVFEQPRRVICVDTNSLNWVRATWPSLAHKLTHIPNYVDLERFKPPHKPRAEPPLILIPRRAEIIRGTRLLEPMLECLTDECRVLWLGDGYKDELQILRGLTTKDERFKLTAASLKQMPDYYRSAQICVIPSIASEGTSLACLEAMASGCAVVATNVGGLGELVKDHCNGLLCEPRPEALADGIRRLLRDPELRDRLQRNARLLAEDYGIGHWRRRWAASLAELGWIAPERAAALQTSQEPGAGTISLAPRSTPADGFTPSASDGADTYDVVCFPIIDWEFRWQRPQQIMSAWAKRGRRVFYLRITDFLPLDGEPIQVRELEKNVWEVRLALPETFDVYHGILPEAFVAHGLEALRCLRNRFGLTEAISVVEKASWSPLAQAANSAFNWTLVYDCMDDWRTFPNISDQQELLTLEDDLVEAADLLVVSSETIAERWRPVRPDLLLARNASDFEFFHAAQGDDPIPDISGPVAGYFGAIASWFDIELITHAARVRPNVSFVLVGEVFDIAVAELETLDNVHMTGAQPYEKMPAYLRRFDACLVPFKVSEATAGMDVVKFYEYISQGKPVVSTPIKEIVSYNDYLYLAGDKEEFVRQLDLALAETKQALRDSRISLARENTWNKRLTEMEEHIAKKRGEAALNRLLASVAKQRQHESSKGAKDPDAGSPIDHHLVRLQKDIDTQQQALSILNDRLAAQAAEADGLKARLDGLLAELRGRDAHILGQQDQIRSLEETRDSARLEATALKDARDAARLEATALKEARDSARQEATALKEASDAARQEATALKEELTREREACQALRRSSAEARLKITSLEDERARWQNSRAWRAANLYSRWRRFLRRKLGFPAA